MERERSNYDRREFLDGNKLNKDGKEHIQRLWGRTVGDKSYQEIEKELPKYFEQLGDTVFDKKVKKSFKLRANAVQRREFVQEIQQPGSEWNDIYKFLKEENPRARDTDIAALILKNKPDPSQQEEALLKKKNEFGRNVLKLTEVGLIAMGFWFLGNAAVEAKQRQDISRDDKQRAAMIMEMTATPQVLYTATIEATETKTIQNTPTATPAPTQEIVKKEVKSFALKGIDLSRPIQIEMPSAKINFENMPLVNWETGGWQQEQTERFNQIENPQETVITRTDVEGLKVIIGHSFSEHGKPLPFDPLVKTPADKLLGQIITIKQAGTENKEDFVVTFVNSIPVAQYTNSAAAGNGENPLYLRTDYSQDKQGNSYGLGIPDSERQGEGVILIACSGFPNGNPEEKYSERRIVVARPVEKTQVSETSYVQQVQYLVEEINNYGTSHMPSDSEKLGDYLKKTGWYNGKSPDEKKRLASVLSVLNNKTYAYDGPNGPEAMQCIDAVSLWSAIGDINSPKNVGALVINNARDVLEKPQEYNFKIKGSVNEIGLEKLAPGDLVMFGPHFVTVIDKYQKNGKWVVTFAEVNRHKDGRAQIYTVEENSQIAMLFPEGAMVGRQDN